jgi:hypothetical protein
MNRRQLMTLLTGTSVLWQGAARAKDAKGETESAPRWKFLGDDASLRETIQEAEQVLLVCV